MSLTFLVSIIVVLIIVGALLYLVNNVVPIDAKIKTVINVVVIVVVLLWLVGALSGRGPVIRW